MNRCVAVVDWRETAILVTGLTGGLAVTNGWYPVAIMVVVVEVELLVLDVLVVILTQSPLNASQWASSPVDRNPRGESNIEYGCRGASRY